MLQNNAFYTRFYKNWILRQLSKKYLNKLFTFSFPIFFFQLANNLEKNFEFWVYLVFSRKGIVSELMHWKETILQ